jgi:hypothetical protein
MTKSRNYDQEQHEQYLASIEDYLQTNFPPTQEASSRQLIHSYWQNHLAKDRREKQVSKLQNRALANGLGEPVRRSYFHVPTVLSIFAEREQYSDSKVLTLEKRIAVLLTAVSSELQIREQQYTEVAMNREQMYGGDYDEPDSTELVRLRGELQLLRDQQKTLQGFLQELGSGDSSLMDNESHR